MASKQEMLDMAARLRATVSESKRRMLDEAAMMLEEAAWLTHERGYWLCEINPNFSPFDGSPSHIYMDSQAEDGRAGAVRARHPVSRCPGAGYSGAGDEAISTYAYCPAGRMPRTRRSVPRLHKAGK